MQLHIIGNFAERGLFQTVLNDYEPRFYASDDPTSNSSCQL